MKTIKNLFFSMATLVALSVSFTSCDAITDALSKEVEVEAPAIDFSIGVAPQSGVSSRQGVNSVNDEYTWYNDSVDISKKLQEELEKSSLTLDNVKGLKITASNIEISTILTTYPALGNLELYIDNVKIATAVSNITLTNKIISFTFVSPYDIFSKLGAGKVLVKIKSDVKKPSTLLQMKLYNTFLGKVSLI